MDLGSILVLLALLVLVSLYIARPLLEKRGSAVTQEEHDLSALLAERDRMINALQELDFDYALGKIPEEDYPAQRARMLQYGAEILRKLDAYQIKDHATAAQKLESAEDRLEQAIARRAAGRLSPAVVNAGVADVPSADDQIEALIAQRRRQRQGKAAGFCHQCGSPLQQSDRFCPRCGKKID